MLPNFALRNGLSMEMTPADFLVQILHQDINISNPLRAYILSRRSGYVPLKCALIEQLLKTVQLNFGEHM